MAGFNFDAFSKFKKDRVKNENYNKLENLIDEFIEKYDKIKSENLENKDKLIKIIDLYFSVPKEYRQNVVFLCQLKSKGFKDVWLYRYLGDDASLEDGYKFFSNPENVKKLYSVGLDFRDVYSSGVYIDISGFENYPTPKLLSLKDKTIDSLKKDYITRNSFNVPCENFNTILTLIKRDADYIACIPEEKLNKRLIYKYISSNHDVLEYFARKQVTNKSLNEILIPDNFGEVNLTDKNLLKFLIGSQRVFNENGRNRFNCASFIRTADQSLLNDKDFLLELIDLNFKIYNFLDDERKRDAELVFATLLKINDVNPRHFYCGNPDPEYLDYPEDLDPNLREIVDEYIKLFHVKSLSSNELRFELEENMRQYLLYMKQERDKAKEQPKQESPKRVSGLGEQ